MPVKPRKTGPVYASLWAYASPERAPVILEDAFGEHSANSTMAAAAASVLSEYVTMQEMPEGYTWIGVTVEPGGVPTVEYTIAISRITG
ncbi:hypothetical protein [Saccharothrix sp. HUAS TT1]|uniref:hypothetical protein n=1 Tax=unclassified Saccharothrix TaxID=2593673 RepID=UPI00345C242B